MKRVSLSTNEKIKRIIWGVLLLTGIAMNAALDMQLWGWAGQWVWPWVWAGLFTAAGCGALALLITERGPGRVPPALVALVLLGTAGLIGLQAVTGFLAGSADDMSAWANWTVWVAPLLFGLVGLGFVASYLAAGRERWKLPAGAALLTLALEGVAAYASPFLAGFVYVIGFLVTAGLILKGHSSGSQPTHAGGQPALHS